VVGWVNGDVL
jgi:hypothetical protein